MDKAITDWDLEQLPLRMIVAFAVRSVKRVQPLFRSDRPVDERTLRRMIQRAEAFAADEAAYQTTAVHDPSAFPPSQNTFLAFAELVPGPSFNPTFHFADDASGHVAEAVAEAAAAARSARSVPEDAAGKAAPAPHEMPPWWHPRTSDSYASGTAHATRNAARLARAAVRAATRDAGDRGAAVLAAIAAEKHDWGRLLELARERGQSYPGLGDTIDASEAGPLGPLWPEGAPQSLKARFAQPEAECGRSARQKVETRSTARTTRFNNLVVTAERGHNESKGLLKQWLMHSSPSHFPPDLFPDGLTIVLFGWKDSGKTTLVRYLQSKRVDVPSPTIGVAREDFVIRWPVPQGPTRSATLWDIGGDYEALFYSTLGEHPPDGVIFVVHHENRNAHKQAWDAFCDFIAKRGFGASSSNAARRNLAAVLVLTNMKDIWSHKQLVWRPEYVDRKKRNPYYMAPGEMKRFFEVERRKEQLAKVGIRVVYGECSVKKCDGVDDAMIDFLDAILANRKTKHRRG